MPTTYDVRDTLADMPDAARDYIMQLLRIGSDDNDREDPHRDDADHSDYPDPADYGLTDTECQHYVEEALPRIVQTVGGPSYHVSPPPAGASYQQVVEHYTTQVQQVAGDYYHVTGDGNIVGDGAQGMTGDGSAWAFGFGAEAQAQSGTGNIQVGDGIEDSVVGQGAEGVASGGGDVGAVGFGPGDVAGTTGDGSPAGDVTIGEAEGNVNFGGNQANLDVTGIDNSTEIEDSFNAQDSFNQDNSIDVQDSFNQDNDLVDIDDNDAIDIA
jgi:hypothetical protein